AAGGQPGPGEDRAGHLRRGAGRAGGVSGHVFARSPRAELPVVVSGTGAEVVDAAGRRYLDGSGGAIVVGIGHGVTEVVDAIAEQSRRIAYVHGTAFTSASVETYRDDVWAGL